jgi:hypothetical protein
MLPAKISGANNVVMQVVGRPLTHDRQLSHVRMSNSMNRYLISLFAVLAICLAAPGSAYAYLDPVSGSIILQVILGGLAGGAVLLKLFWRRIRGLFGAGVGGGTGDDKPSV